MRSSTTRRLFVAISVAMLVLCQTAAAAMSRAIAVPAPLAAAQSEKAPCQRDAAATEHDAPSQGCHERCPARDALVEAAKIDIPNAICFTPLVLSTSFFAATIPVAAPFKEIPERVASPPARLAYCRLLN